MTMMNRRKFLIASSAGVVSAAFSSPLLAATSRIQSHPLVASAGVANITSDPEIETGVWQYNGVTPGPTIRVKQGEPVSIPFENRLDQPTTVHWHGPRIANNMDGVPGLTQPVVEPGKTFHYQFTSRDAGTFWYHTHNRTWEQLARGLYGVLIVEERAPIRIDQDLVCVVDDWLIDDQGKIDDESFGNLHDWAHSGRLGNVLTVNGAHQPVFQVRSGERIRLRVLNVANARIMPLRVKGVKATAIAIDGQPITPEVLTKGEFTLAPAQRIDLVLDMLLAPGQQTEIEFIGRRKNLIAATLKCHPTEVRRTRPLEASIELPQNPLPSSGDWSRATRFQLSMEGGAMGRMQGAEYNGQWMGIRDLIKEKKIWALNGIAGLPEKPFFSVRRGTSVVVDLENQNAWPHAMHVHGHHFREIGGSKEGKSVWRDTVLVEPGKTRRIAFVADNPGKWLIHCHMIEHHAGGMVTWFEVI